jgi:hypothetical protein
VTNSRVEGAPVPGQAERGSRLQIAAFTRSIEWLAALRQERKLNCLLSKTEDGVSARRL